MTLKNFLITVFVIYSFFSPVSSQAKSLKAGPQPVQESIFPLFTFKGFDFADKNDKNWDVHCGGRFSADLTRYGNDNQKNSGFRWNAAILRISGQHNSLFNFYIEPDLLGTNSKNNLYQAWIALEIISGLRLKTGIIKVALNSEFATNQEKFPVAGYGFASFLDGRYDFGISINGEALEETLWYEAVAAMGEGFDLAGRKRENLQFSARMTVFPMKNNDWYIIKNTFFEVSLAWSPDYDDEIYLETPLQSKVFITKNLDGDEALWIHAEIGYYFGQFMACLERVEGKINAVKTPEGYNYDFDQLTAWTGYCAWNITGEPMGWEKGGWISGNKKFSKNKIESVIDSINNIGRLELAFRYSNADIDRALFDYGLTGYNPSTQEVRTISLNLNWYPADSLRITGGWIKTIADHELSVFDETSRDSSFLLRADLTF